MGKNKASLMLLLVGFYTGTFQTHIKQEKTVLLENLKMNISISIYVVLFTSDICFRWTRKFENTSEIQFLIPKKTNYLMQKIHIISIMAEF